MPCYTSRHVGDGIAGAIVAAETADRRGGEEAGVDLAVSGVVNMEGVDTGAGDEGDIGEDAIEAGGFWKLWKAMRSRNACKTCALGMGGQKGGMVNEAGSFPEVCKKSLQDMAADMQGAIAPEFWRKYTVAQLATFSPRELEHCGRLTQPLIHLRGSRHYEPISWDLALDRIAKKLRDTPPDRSFWYFSGRSSNEAGFLLQLFARLYGTNNVNN